jgi:predicted helicase
VQLIANGQCYPLYLFETQKQQRDDGSQANLFTAPPLSTPTYRRKDALTDAGLAHFQNAYPGESIGKEDVFYYVYGLLHSPDYRARYADSLSKQLPRIPRVASAAAFWAFSRAGRALADLHIGYESAPLYPVAFDLAKPFDQFAPGDYRVTQMKFANGTETKHDKTTVSYNHNVTMKGIPLEAYDYVVNGKSALEWVMERQAVTTHKESGIVNDANDWALETMHNPAYPLELFQRIITVSLETLRIVGSLPALALREDG